MGWNRYTGEIVLHILRGGQGSWDNDFCIQATVLNKRTGESKTFYGHIAVLTRPEY